MSEKKEEKPTAGNEENKSLNEELKTAQEKYLRTLAELDNMRKRMQKEKQDMIGFAIENTICEFLPLLDNFENALKFAQAGSEELKGWASGFQMILSQFRDIIHNHDIVAFHSEGNFFDPDYHEAMEIIETGEYPDGTIIEEYAKGYKSNNRIIRPAKVKVAKSPKTNTENEELKALEGEEKN